MIHSPRPSTRSPLYARWAEYSTQCMKRPYRASRPPSTIIFAQMLGLGRAGRLNPAAPGDMKIAFSRVPRGQDEQQFLLSTGITLHSPVRLADAGSHHVSMSPMPTPMPPGRPGGFLLDLGFWSVAVGGLLSPLCSPRSARGATTWAGRSRRLLGSSNLSVSALYPNEPLHS